ncbi:DUF3800 domain-containing protein [Jannaschia formosa]|uniref:DUF3800 domain-containing protein n=1 Tax=Jannaschia formosa TaxID=2259592 RepID=UPI000E1C0E26|nr:DUF3800 domain-containing protein [Jannaschia formosa]TFL17251.1 DUF3800 domain-containing protein [Jannaschia formosa]
MYRLYLDEHGTDSMTRLDLPQKRYLSLTGVMMRVDHARDYLVPALSRIKADILDEDPDAPICLHRADIRQSKGPFQPLSDGATRLRFDEQLLRVMRDAEYIVITVFLDKLGMDGMFHWKRTHPYHFLMEVMVEKYTLCLQARNATGDIMPEARGKHQDKALQDEFTRVRTHGTRYVTQSRISTFIPSRNLKFRTKKDNVAGLQLCDLLAHPSHFTIRQNLKHPVTLGDFAERVSEILASQKYNRSAYGKVWGWGAKALP